MINEEDEYFLRASILLLKGGRLMSKGTLYKELQKAGGKGNLDAILKQHERKLKHKFVKKQRKKLFPDVGVTDVETWDLAMLTTVTLTVFKRSLSGTEKEDLKSLKSIRDEVYAHTRSSSLSVDQYKEIREELEKALTSLSNGLGGSLKDGCNEIIQECTTGPISPSLKAELSKLIDDTDDLFQAIMNKLRDQKEFLCELRNELLEEIRGVKLTEDRSTKKIKVIDTELMLSGAVNEKEDLDFVEDIVTKIINKAIKKVGDNDYPRIRNAVEKILRDIESMPDVEILPAEHKCIILKFRCTSYAGIYDVILYLESGRFLDSLNDLALALSTIKTSVSGQFRLDATVTPKCLKDLLDELRSETLEPARYKRTIRMPVEVKTTKGIKHIWSLFESGGATNSVNELSEAVFEELHTKITVTPSLNLEHVQAAIKESVEDSEIAVEDDASPPELHQVKPADKDNKSAETSQVAFEDDACSPEKHQRKSADKGENSTEDLQVATEDDATLKIHRGKPVDTEDQQEAAENNTGPEYFRSILGDKGDIAADDSQVAARDDANPPKRHQSKSTDKASTSGRVKMKKSIHYSRMKQPPLIKQLKGILSEYPDGGQILKELIQNAEDAGAREVKILHDNRRINYTSSDYIMCETENEEVSERSEKTQLHTKFFKGPALCVYNDAVFTENDWEGIQMIYSSVKEEDPLKVGRFSLGFKSVFHITDFPCVISGDRILLIDPQQCTEKVNASLDICALGEYTEEGLNSEAFWDVLEDTFGLSRNTLGVDGFRGTLLWFPLREKPSDISETLYNKTKVENLFDCFKTEASDILLFLKNIEKITLHIRDAEESLKEILRIEIEDKDGILRQTRNAFKECIEDKNSTLESADIHSTVQLVIHTSSVNTSKRQEWLVVDYFIRESASEGFKHMMQNKNLGYSPYVGVAVPLYGMLEEFEGHVFCFLPLPRDGERLTGLPVHVNGFFALNQNRHYMKWETEGQEGTQIDDKSILWNRALIEEALPKAYELLVLEAIKIAETNSNDEAFVTAVYNMMPVCTNSPIITHKRWKMLENKLYECLEKRNIIYATQSNEWIALNKAFFSTFRTLSGIEIDAAMQEAITKCLHKVGLKYTRFPNPLFDTLQMHFPYIKDLTPGSLVNHLQQRNEYREMACNEKIQVLAYLLLEEGNFVNFEGIELLPLASDRWTVFNKGNDPVYLCTDAAVKMFPGLEDKLMMESRKLGVPLSEKIASICKSETYQIQRLNVDCAKTLLKQTLRHHVGSDTLVRLTPESSLTSQWLENVWHMLIGENKVKHFKDIPLVPVLMQGSWTVPHIIELVRLSDFMIVKESEGSVLADGLCSCLHAMNVKILTSLPVWIPFEFIQEFVYRPTKKGIVSLLGAMYKRTGDMVVSEFNIASQVNSQISEAMNQFASTLAYIENDVVKLFRKLQLFRAVRRIDEKGQYTSVAHVPRYIHEDINFPPGVEFPYICIKLCRSEDNLIKQLEAEIISTESLVLSTIQSLLLHKKHDQISIFMNYFMEHFNLFETNTAICANAAQLPFLKVGTEHHTPAGLFDPSSSSLQRLLLGESLFPEKLRKYSKEEIRTLRRLGLKGRDKIDASVMLQVARTLGIWSNDYQKSHDLSKKAAEFMKHLVHHPDLLDTICNETTTLGNALMQVSCIPVVQNAPVDYPKGVPWFSEEVKICKPSEAKVVEWALLVGATVPMVECACDKIVDMFEWNVAPKIHTVLQQLAFIRQHYNVKNKPDYMRAVQGIYNHLNQFEEEISKLQNILGNDAVIWTGFGFELPGKVIITKREQDLDLKPYFYNLPEEIWDMDDLFLQFGCHLEQNSDILLSVLQSIKLKYESCTESHYSVSRDSNIVLEILKVLALRRKEGSLEIDDSKMLMLVKTQSSDKLCLQYVSHCIFDGDQDKLDQDEEKNVHVVSEVIPLHVAKDLGVKSVQRKTILRDTDEFSCEEWGQHETLTTRISSLLRDGYTDGLSVPKELVQNADDAGATVVKFLYDERENNDAKRKDRLFSSNLREWQGPALWVYNDSQFTDKDLENITKLNCGTKADYQDKIGKFGLGFCSVYNLTDVPSFISGENMVIFDPQEMYLWEAGRKCGAGLRVTLSKRHLIPRKVDQLKPYSAVFGCNLLDSSFTDFSGTLFRLPLRTEHQASKSKICEQAYTKEEVSILLSKLVENAGNILLFTQNVKTLQIYYLPKDETDPSQAKLLFNINKKVEQYSHDGISRHAQSVLKRVPIILKNDMDFTEIHYVKINQTRFECSFLKPNSEVSDSASVETNWIVSWALGKNESLRLFKRLSEKGAVPLSAVAVPMSNKNDKVPLMLHEVPTGFYKEGHMFCFLPLPIRTRLQVHVNGCFSVTSDRRGLSGFTEDDKRKGDNYMWNQALMEDSLVQSYVHLLMFLSTQCSDSYSYHSLWPSVGSDDIQVFKRRFYETLILDKPKLFRGAKDWLSVDEVVFLDPTIRCNDTIGDIAFEFVSALPIRPGRNIIELPRHVLLSIQDCKCDSKSVFLEAMVKQEELIFHFLCTLDSVFWHHQLHKRNTLIFFALQTKNKLVFAKLQETKCIPSEPNNVLCRPNQLICPSSEIANMFDVAEGHFPFQSDGFSEKKVVVQLISLGMHDKILPKNMFVQRCMSIEELLRVCGSCAKERCVRFLKYCGQREVMHELEKDTSTLNKIKHTLLMPVLPSPSSWKFTWKADSLEEHSSNAKCGKHVKGMDTCIRFEKPGNLFRESYYNCIGSVSVFVHENYLRRKCPVSDRLLHMLGVKSELTIELLLQQITQLSDQYISSEKNLNSLDAISHSVYEWLARFTGDKSEKEILQMPCFRNMRQKPLIVIGNELVMPCKVAFKVIAECPPELYCLREMDDKRAKVFKAFGVEDHFSIDYLISILKRLYITWFKRVCTDINTVTCVLLNLCESMKLEHVLYEELEGEHASIVAPDSDGILRPTNELVIEDSANKSSAILHVLHGNLPPDAGRALGVKSKQRKIVELVSSGFFLSFGQKESLVTRLTGILQDYPCDSSIMKELIQNADDAGATEIYFIKNYVSYSSEKIFGNESLQGPSLCIFNDSYFTEEDFNGIRYLGIGSKREDPSTTGQYGIGFNAVYHLTDVPSFLTKGPGLGNRGQMCIFDPLMAYLEGHVTIENPGIKCDAGLMEESFPDMLQGYPVVPSIETSGQGTIFRLPLRQSKSDISNNVVSVERMDRLIEAFKNDMFECLLFLKSIKCIKVLNNSNGELIEELSVETKLSAEDGYIRAGYFSSVKEVIKANSDDRHQNLCRPPIEASYRITIEDTKGKIERWLIVNRFGIDRRDDKYSTIINALKEKNIGLTPVASVALLWPNDDWKNCPDRTSHQIHKEQGIRKTFCFLPLPVPTGLPLHVNGHFALDKARTKLWNKGIRKCWNVFVIEEILSRAYISAIQYIKREFVCQNLHAMVTKQVRSAAFERYHENFPHWEKATDSYWKSLVRSFYLIVIGEEIEIFPSIRVDTVHTISERPTEDIQELQLDWVSLSKSENDFSGTFNVISKQVESQFSSSEKPFYIEDALSVENTVKKMGMKVIETPMSVSSSISQSGIKYIPSCSPDLVIQYIKSFADGTEKACHLGGINVSLSKTTMSDLTALKSMLRYVIKDQLFKEKVEGLPLCVTNSGLLQTFSKHVPKFCSNMGDVLSGSADQFVHSQLLLLLDRREYHEAGVIKDFEVTDLVSYIGETFDPSTFATVNHVMWNKQSGCPVKPYILKRVFEFIHSKSLDIDTKQINHEVFQSNVRKLNDWSLIPSRYDYGSKTTFEIVPVCQTTHLFHKSVGNDDLGKVIEKFNIPQLDTSTFDKNGGHLIYALHKLLPSTRLPIELLNCLLYYKTSIQASTLTCEESISILSYFDNKITHMKQTLNEAALRNMFKNLPLYVSHQRNILSIEGYSDVVVLPFGMPTEGINVWAHSTGILLLRDTEKLLKLYQFLHLPRKTELEVYSEKIIRSFHFLPRNTWITHIKYMKNKLLKTSLHRELDDKQSYLVEQLKDLAFVRVSEVDKRVNELYDYYHPVFSCMLTEDCFIPQEYRESSWAKFMELLGLIKEPTDEMLISFAQSLEANNSSPLNDVTVKQSWALIDCLLNGKWKEQTLTQIKGLRFVAPYKVDLQRLNVANQPGNGKALICFSGATSFVHADYCWSSLNLLLRVPTSPEMLKHLGIYKYPPIDTVVQHCQNVAGAFKKELEKQTPGVSPSFVKEQMELLYEMLLKHFHSTMQQEFDVTPIVFHPEDRKMLQVNQIVINLTEEEEVRPFLYKLPNCFVPFRELFVKLGSHDHVYCSHYSLVLETIKGQFGNRPLPPNQLYFVKRALQNIIKHIEKEPNPLQNVKHLYLPDRKQVLVSSKSLTVSNNVDVEERLGGKLEIDFFLGFRDLDITSVSDPVLPFLKCPEDLKPDILTDVVTEKVSLDDIERKESLLAQRIEFSFRSPLFVEGILRLVKHQMKLNMKNFDRDIENSFLVSLTNIRISKVSGLKTFLTYKGRMIDGTDRIATCFMQTHEINQEDGEIKEHELLFQMDAEQDLLIQLIEEQNGLVKLVDTCTEDILEKHLSQHIPSVLRLLEKPSEIRLKLDRLRIDAYDLPASFTISVFPRPGTYVEEKFHPFLEQSISPIKKHEYMYVALEVEDADDVTDPVYIYAHIINENWRSQGQSVLSITYRVDVGYSSDGFINIPLYRLYIFKPKQPEEIKASVMYDIEPIGSILIDENFRCVRQILINAWSMDETERNRIIRRCLTRWHPDRNMSHREYAERLFNYVKEIVIKLENNEIIDDYITHDTGRKPPDMSHSSFWLTSSAIYNRGCRYAAAFYHNMHDYNRSTRTGNYAHHREEEGLLRHIGEAKRWHQQAVHDFKAAESNVSTGEQDKSFNWVCYKCHQASEKALKAAWFAKNANRATVREHSLTVIANDLDEGAFLVEASNLEGITEDYSCMLYPDAVVGRKKIPLEMFDRTKAEQAIEVTKRILDMAANVINLA